jgi:hypothetical protein
MEAHSIYAKFAMTPDDFNRWLEIVTPLVSDFDDWSRMNPSWSESFKEDVPELCPMTVKQLLEGWTYDVFNESPLVTSYDPIRGEFVLFQALYDNNLINIAIGIARLRSAQQFCKPGSRSYVLVAPLFWEPGITALLEILDGNSNFLPEDAVPPGLMDEAGALLDQYLQAHND